MSEYIIKLPNGGAANECIRLRGYEKSLYGYELHEEIVRCRDCKWFDADLYVLPNDENWVYSCDLWGVMSHVPNPDGFCSWGERRES